MVSGSFALLCYFLMSVLNVGRAAESKRTMPCRIQGESLCTSVHLSIRKIERKEERKKRNTERKKEGRIEREKERR